VLIFCGQHFRLSAAGLVIPGKRPEGTLLLLASPHWWFLLGPQGTLTAL